ncbi:hypothetical protein C7N43_24145 [Sphingobacteriales bacterium UPWRP_1]|nr:hypothetical protein BVG80_13455 [Sphingobacteriales bacterium TSM_CSM]PSJ74400.1 hypothetical protein C7N43_24145 [Sphingobacteriales bacterium UPWRP_1]
MKKLLFTFMLLFLAVAAAWAQNATGAPTANAGNSENLLIVLIMVTGVVLVAAVYVILKAVSALSNEMRIHASKKKA